MSTIVVIYNEKTSTKAANEYWSDHTEAVSINNEGWYEVDTAEKLAYISAHYTTFESANIKLTNDISLSGHYWIPIQEFSGTFDGQNFKITGMQVKENTYSNSGLFGTLNKANVWSVRFYNCSVYSNYNSGIISGLVDNSLVSDIIMENCNIVACGNSNTNNVNCGGIIGKATNTWISSCKVYNNSGYNIRSYLNSSVSYSFKTYCGGIVGQALEGCLFWGCWVNGGEIKTANPSNLNYSKYSYCGGICGYADSMTLSGCFNNGARIYANSNAESGEAYGGGIVGMVTTSSTILNCYNTGTIDGYVKVTMSETNYLYSEYLGKIQVTSSYDGNTRGYWSAGKVTDKGYGDSGSKVQYDVIKRENKKVYLGGIAGYVSGSIEIKDCYNIGNVSQIGKCESILIIYCKTWLDSRIEKSCDIKEYCQYSFLENCKTGNIIGNGYSANLYTTDIDRCYFKETSKIKLVPKIKFNDKYFYNLGEIRIEDIVSEQTGYWNYLDTGLNFIHCGRKMESKITYHKINVMRSYECIIEDDFSNSAVLDYYGTHKSDLKTVELSDLGFSSDIWAKDSKINGGYPYLKEFYW